MITLSDKSDYEKLVNAIVSADKFISTSDHDATKFLCALLTIGGSNKDDVKELSKCQKFSFYWDNAEANGLINKDGTINVSEEWDNASGIEFIMLLMCVQGLVRRNNIRPNKEKKEGAK